MKTSILISGIAALYLMGTFAIVPRRHGEDKTNFTSHDNISIVTTGNATMLPGVIITADRIKESGIQIPLVPAEDFSYLEFDVTEYVEGDAYDANQAEVLPEATEIDFSYLKFNINDYISDSESAVDEIKELPVNETNTTAAEPVINEFEYLRFDVNDYISNSVTEDAGTGELPAAEANNTNKAVIPLENKTPLDFSYLKFDVTRYYSSANPDADYQSELPEE